MVESKTNSHGEESLSASLSLGGSNETDNAAQDKLIREMGGIKANLF